MQLNLGQAAFIGIFINKDSKELDLPLLILGIVFTISACIFIAFSSKDKKSPSSNTYHRHKIHLLRDTKLVVDVEPKD